MLTQTATQSYQQNNVKTADPLKLILMVYDRAISGCRQRDLKTAGRAISELIRALNMDAGDISWNLLSIYEYCGDLIREDKYDEAMNILKELRNTWSNLKQESVR